MWKNRDLLGVQVCWTEKLGAFGMLKAWYFHISKGKWSVLWSFHTKTGKKPVRKHSQREGGHIIWPAKTKDGIVWDLEAENIKEYLDPIQNLNWDGFAIFQTIMLKRQRQHSDLHNWNLCSGTWKKSRVWFFKKGMNRTLRPSLRYNSLIHQQVFRWKQRTKSHWR